MTCGFRNAAGTDLENLFYSEYANPGALGFKKSDGYDLGNQFTNKTTLGYAVGYKNSAGTDMGYLRGAVDPKTMFGIYKPAGWPWDVGITNHYITNQDWWKSWFVGQIHGGFTGAVKVDGVENDCIYRDIDSDFDYGVAFFVYNSLKDVEVTFTAKHVYHTSNESDDYIAQFELTVDPYCKGFYFKPCVGAGDNSVDIYRFTADLGPWGSRVYEVCLGVRNDDNHDTYGSEASVRSFSYNGKAYVFYRG